MSPGLDNGRGLEPVKPLRSRKVREPVRATRPCGCIRASSTPVSEASGPRECWW